MGANLGLCHANGSALVDCAENNEKAAQRPMSIEKPPLRHNAWYNLVFPLHSALLKSECGFWASYLIIRNEVERKCEMETCQGMLWCPRAHVFWGWSSRFICSHRPSCALSGDKGYVYFRLPFKLLAWNAWCINAHHERYYVVGSWKFVPVLLLNVVYIQSHASAVIDLCIDNRTGVLPYWEGIDLLFWESSMI